jgi:hypothetical protein
MKITETKFNELFVARIVINIMIMNLVYKHFKSSLLMFVNELNTKEQNRTEQKISLLTQVTYNITHEYT